mmetsp:Transcript_28809/g.65924  ORF Transcript_28809/g.65924 Transcript_28809/m.65924 type:complete len:227 (-) Transcript_28809:186-866(-)
MVLAPASMHRSKRRGLSAVRPAIRQTVGRWLRVPSSSTLPTHLIPRERRSSTMVVNSRGTFGHPSPRKKGSTTPITRTRRISRSWVRWYHPIPRLGSPHPTTTTSTASIFFSLPRIVRTMTIATHRHVNKIAAEKYDISATASCACSSREANEIGGGGGGGGGERSATVGLWRRHFWNRPASALGSRCSRPRTWYRSALERAFMIAIERMLKRWYLFVRSIDRSFV